MQLSPELERSLVDVGTWMRRANDPWWVIASAAAALHGASPIIVRDVDVLLSVDDARRLLPDLGITPGPGKADGVFRSSLFGRWHAPPLDVEFMAGLHLRDGAGWREVKLETRQSIMIANVAVFVPSRAELIALFNSFGRSKDLERAQLLSTLD